MTEERREKGEGRKRKVRERTGVSLFALLPSLLAFLMSGCKDPGGKGSPPPESTAQAKNVSKDPWTLQTDSPVGIHGGYLGNGFIGMRFGASGTTDSPDGKAPAHDPKNKGRDLLCVVAGLYSHEQLVPAPNWGSLQFEAGGVLAQPENGNVTGYRQTLDLRHGELQTSYTVPSAKPAFSVALTTRVHRDNPHLVTLSARIMPDADGAVRIHFPPPVPQKEYFELSGGAAPVPSAARSLVLKGAESPASRYLTLIQRIDVKDDQNKDVPGDLTEIDGVRSYGVKVRRPIIVTKWVYVDASDHYDPEALENGSDELERLQARGLPTLAASHRAAWEKLWQSDIRIDGDLEAQQAVRSSLFYLLSSVREGGQWSIPPMGLSGTQWGGHLFWDADMWMFPVLGVLHPELARNIVDYRYRTLGGARWNAKQRGFKGADYATESAVTGRELAPAEFPFERHNTADVGIAQWRQFLLSGDRKWLSERGYPILKETALYWQSRVVFNPPKDRYEIRHVISPDETAGFVDNDAYTNAGAKLNLRYAIEASRLLGKSYPPEWKTIADKLWLPFDAANRRYLEHEGYKESRRKSKQADAQLLFFPLDLPAPPDVRGNTLAYYAAHTSPVGPAMTSSVHAIIAADLAAAKPPLASPSKGKTVDWKAEAADYFRQSYRPFVRPPFNDFSEKRPTNNTTFLTGCAGVAMAALYGFGGIHYDADRIEAKPVLPAGWTRLEIRGIHYRGQVYDLAVKPQAGGHLVARKNP